MLRQSGTLRMKTHTHTHTHTHRGRVENGGLKKKRIIIPGSLSPIPYPLAIHSQHPLIPSYAPFTHVPSSLILLFPFVDSHVGQSTPFPSPPPTLSSPAWGSSPRCRRRRSRRCPRERSAPRPTWPCGPPCSLSGSGKSGCR